MANAPGTKDPLVFSYLTLRKFVGWLALGLPVVLVGCWWFPGGHGIEGSISSYYYTGMRNFLVGGLSAISMFMLACRGYDRADEIAGIFSGICALGVAFFPTAPETGATAQQRTIGEWHYVFAVLLFSTLAFFCLFLFKKTADKKAMTRKKGQRNHVYTVCGYAIVASMLLIFVLVKLLKIERLVGSLSPMLCFETTALWAFGIAWLIKGETFLKDEKAEPSTTPSAGAPLDDLPAA